MLYVGCPVWSFKGWVGNFYPKGTKPSEFLREYARRVTTIEGNTTFYAVPTQKTIAQWVSETPETFQFCPKIPKAISHEGRLVDQVDRARAFVDVMTGLGERLGPMFLQLPPRYSPRLIGDLSTFLSSWGGEVDLAVEVRHPDWFVSPHDEALNQLLSDRNMARVTIDTRPIRDLAGDKVLTGSAYESLLEARERKPDVPVIPKRTADFIFVRYIGHPQIEINRPLLEAWGKYFASAMKSGADVFMFCHSPDNIAAPDLCRELHRQVRRHVSVPPLPWDELQPHEPEQPSLF